MVTNGKVRVIRYFSKALQGAQLNWSAREKECYGIYYGVKQFEDLIDKRHFILKNLTYINVTLTRKVLRQKWKHPSHRLPSRRHSSEKQAVIRSQTEALLKLAVIEESKATEWSQVYLVPKPNPNKWRFTLDFVRLNTRTGGLEGWLIPNIQVIGTLKPKMFGLIDFTAGYHQTPLHEKSSDLSAFITADGLYQWTRVAMGLKGAGPIFSAVWRVKSLQDSSTASVSCILTTC